MLVADSTPQTSLVGGIEPDRDQYRSARSRRVNLVGVFERNSVAPIGDRRECLRVCRSLGFAVRVVPAANLGVDLLAIVAADPIVHRPAALRRLGEFGCLEHFGHGQVEFGASGPRIVPEILPG